MGFRKLRRVEEGLGGLRVSEPSWSSKIRVTRIEEGVGFPNMGVFPVP